MKCYLLSTDLMLGSQIQGAVSQCNSELITLRDPADQDDPEGIAIVDLASLKQDITATVEQLARTSKAVIAIGPHVHGDKLAAAEAAGAVVMSKGDAHRNLANKLRQLAN